MCCQPTNEDKNPRREDKEAWRKHRQISGASAPDRAPEKVPDNDKMRINERAVADRAPNWTCPVCTGWVHRPIRPERVAARMDYP